MDERIKRITEMEQRLNRILVWNAGNRTAKDTIQEDVRTLDEYYKSPLWREDYEADEAGMIPKDLPRGILSEDGIYNALEDYDYTMQTKDKIPPEQAMHDMILAMIYLTRFTDNKLEKYEDTPLFRAWKSYDWDTLDKLSEEKLIIDRHGNKSLYLTDEGVAKAKEILEKYGIADWEKKQ